MFFRMVPSNNKVLHGVAVWQRCLLMQLHRLDVVLNRPPASGLCMAVLTSHAMPFTVQVSGLREEQIACASGFLFQILRSTLIPTNGTNVEH